MKLATEPGIQMIEALVDLMTDDGADADTTFMNITTPFLRTLAH